MEEQRTEYPTDQNEDSDEIPWSGWDEFIANIKSKDMKDFMDKATTLISQWQHGKIREKRYEVTLKIAHEKARARSICHYQWIRLILLLTSSSIVGTLIWFDKFQAPAALFFGGLVAYLFGKEPK